jgi:chemotaxis protein CheD
MREFEISLGRLMITKQPAILSISGIGSCVALAVRDNPTSVSGLAHIVLPNSNEADDLSVAPARYADTAVRALIRGLLTAGCELQAMRAKLVGGARVVVEGGFDGYKNVESVRRELAKNGVVIVAEDVGMTYGRSVKFETSTGNVTVRRYQLLDGIAEFKDEITI